MIFHRHLFRACRRADVACLFAPADAVIIAIDATRAATDIDAFVARHYSPCHFSLICHMLHVDTR